MYDLIKKCLTQFEKEREHNGIFRILTFSFYSKLFIQILHSMIVSQGEIRHCRICNSKEDLVGWEEPNTPFEFICRKCFAKIVSKNLK